jgi:hypothetical protein
VVPQRSSATGSYRRRVEQIHQIEVTTRCNLRCPYCPSPNLPREKQDMTWEVFEQSLEVVRFFVRRGTQGELSLTGIGESLLHPRFVEMVACARETIGDDRPLVIATNGLLLDEAMCRAVKRYRPLVFISLHRPEKAGPAVELAKAYGILAGVNASAVTSAFNWAGQVDWYVTAPKIHCEYLRSGWAVILCDGRITTCCLDASGTGVVGSVLGDPSSLVLQPYSLCASCHMQVPD